MQTVEPNILNLCHCILQTSFYSTRSWECPFTCGIRYVARITIVTISEDCLHMACLILYTYLFTVTGSKNKKKKEKIHKKQTIYNISVQHRLFLHERQRKWSGHGRTGRTAADGLEPSGVTDVTNPRLHADDLLEVDRTSTSGTVEG